MFGTVMVQLIALSCEEVKLPRVKNDTLLVKSHLFIVLKIHKGKMRYVRKTGSNLDCRQSKM